MANNIDLVMRLIAEDKASKELSKVSKATGDVGTSAEKTSKSMGLMGKAVGLVSAVAITKFAKDSVAAFSEVQDATDALTATYGESGQALIDWAKKNGDAYNLSRRSALAAEQSFANFAKAAGLSGDQLESFTIDLTKRAADMASYFGGTTEDAITAIGAALRGEQEPIRRYGVLLDDATMRAKALELGLVSTTKNALTPQQKVLAANALILEKTSDVQGDVERTAGSMGNKIKDAQQKFDDLQVSVGETAAVAAGPLLDGVNAALGAFTGLPEPVQSAAVATTALGGAALIAGPRIIAMNTALKASGSLGATVSVGLGKAAKAAGALGVALVAVNAAGAGARAIFGDLDTGGTVKQLAHDLEDAAAAGKLFADTGGELEGRAFSLNEAMLTLAAPGVDERIDSWVSSLTGATSQLDAAEAAVTKVDGALSQMVSGGAARAAADQYQRMKDSFLAAGGAAEDFDRMLPGYHDALLDAAHGQKTLNDTVEDGTEKFESLADAIRSAVSPLLDLAQARNEMRSGLVDLTKALKDNGASIDQNTKKGRDNRAAIYSQVEAAIDFAAKVEAGARARGDSEADAAAKAESAYNRQINGIKKVMRQLGFAGEDIEAVAGKWKQIPRDVTTQYKIDVSMTEVTAAAGRMAGYRVNSRTGGGTLTRAGGGWVSGPGTATSDSIDARLSDGEFVVNAAAAARHGPMLEAINSSVKPGFANGGKVDAARSRYRSVLGSRRSMVSSYRGSLQDFASLTGFDLGAAAAAADDVTAALDAQRSAALDLAEARRRLNAVKPGDETGRADALRAVADAQAKVASSERSVADARKAQAAAAPSAKNMLADMRSKATQIKTLGSVLKKLASKGLNKATLMDIAEAGQQDPQTAVTFANALLSSQSAIDEANTLQRQIDTASGRVAGFAGNVQYGRQLNQAAANLAELRGRGGQKVEVALYIDGKVVHGSLVQLKKRYGGKKLGLD